jgi:hypothetical protein
MTTIQVGGYRKGKFNYEALYSQIDEEDLERAMIHKWTPNRHSGNTIYATSKHNGKKIYLHRLIMGLGDYKDDKRIIDHKDGNGLNNKKENLVICDILYNSQSFRRHHGNCNIGYVYYDTTMKRIKRWRAQVRIMGTRYSKRFLEEQEGRDWIDSLIKEHTNKDK